MKKKTLIWIVLFLILPTIFSGVFIATFNTEFFRPLIVKQLEEALGQPVTLEKVSLGWRGGLALSLKNLEVHSEQQLKVAEINLVVGLVPLLRKELEVSSFSMVRPRFYQKLKPQGSLQVEGVGLEASLGKERLKLKDFSAAVEATTGPDQPGLRGKFSLSFEGTYQGDTPEQIPRTLAGAGRLRITEGALVNVNLLREVFRRISIIPGLAERLSSGLPEAHRRKLEVRDTVLKPADWEYTIQEGGIQFQNIQLEAEDFVLTGTGRLGLDSNLSARMVLRIHPDLSNAIGKSVEELQLLAAGDGSMELPVLAEGKLPSVTVLPDLSYLASHLVAHKAEDLLGGLLQRVLEKKKDSQ